MGLRQCGTNESGTQTKSEDALFILEIRAETAGVLIAIDCVQAPTEVSSTEASPLKFRGVIRCNDRPPCLFIRQSLPHFESPLPLSPLADVLSVIQRIEIASAGRVPLVSARPAYRVASCGKRTAVGATIVCRNSLVGSRGARTHESAPDSQSQIPPQQSFRLTLMPFGGGPVITDCRGTGGSRLPGIQAAGGVPWPMGNGECERLPLLVELVTADARHFAEVQLCLALWTAFVPVAGGQ
jgi:hypothetical protein